MSLNFPNISRSFEAPKGRVRFWGYDSAIEITFFVPAESLIKVCPGTNETEASLLDAFDSSLDRIHQAAGKAYRRDRNRGYVHVLTAQDF